MSRAVTGTTERVDVSQAQRSLWSRLLAAVAALGLVGAAMGLPLWRSHLRAPQYPGGLELVAYGNRAEGDLAEIDGLNHYIGMKPFRLEDFPEVGLWPLGIATAAVAVLVAVFLQGRLVGRLAQIFLWAFPMAILAIIQVRLYQYGHDLDPGAAFRMEGFTPKVVGPTTVWNFTAMSMPGAGVLVLLAAAAIARFGSRLLDRLGMGGRTAMTLLLSAFLIVLGLAPVALAQHEHHGHDPGPVNIEGEGTLLRTVPPRPVFDPERLIDLEALIAATPDSGTLVVPAGAYRGNVVIDRPMTIEGVGWPLLVGDKSGTVLTISASDVVVRGIQVTGSGHGPGGQPAGIRVTGNNVTLEQVAVADSYIGVALEGASRVRVLDSLIVGRIIHGVGDDRHASGGEHSHQTTVGRGDGISIWHVDGATVRGTRLTGTRDAIYISFGQDVVLDSNHITDSRYGVHTMYASELVVIENQIENNLSALVLMYGSDISVLRNQLKLNRSPSTGFGVLVKDVSEIQIVQNVVVGNRVGIHLDGPAGGTEPIRVTANTVANNDHGVMIFPAAQAVLAGNSLIDNLVQVGRAGRGPIDQVSWTDRGWGNYWSTYQGYDGGQGRGTSAHIEGNAMHRILSRSPLLTALAAGPAMRLVGVVEERWIQSRPMAVDELPLTQPISPAVVSPDPEPAAGMALGLIGMLLVASAGAAFATTFRAGR